MKAFLGLLLAAPAVGAGLKFRADGPAPAAAAPPEPKTGIRPGVVVRITNSKSQLESDFSADPGLRYVPMMEEMLGKDFVVVNMQNGGACVYSPDGSEPGGVWCFPMNSLTVWEDTKEAKEPPVAGKAFKAVGLPTKPQVNIDPPARNEAPWDYDVRGRNLMDPVAPAFEKHVDLEKTSQPLPPWLKVKQVASIECMEKMHKDPSHICKPEDYVDYAKVAPTPTTPKPISPAEAKELRSKIKHLQSQIKSLTPKAVKEVTDDRLIDGVRRHPTSMNHAIEKSEKNPRDFDGSKMDIGREGSKQRMHKAQGHGEARAQKLLAEKEPNSEMHLAGWHGPRLAR